MTIDRHPFPDLSLETLDGEDVWVFRGEEMRDENGKPCSFDAVNLLRRMICEGEQVPLEVMGICQWCARKNPENYLTCEAFPVQIPEVIARGDFDHRSPFVGDNGLTFVQRSDVYPTPEDFKRVLPGATH